MMSSLTHELYIYVFIPPKFLQFGLQEPKKLLYKQNMGSAPAHHKAAHTSVTNIQVILFVGPRTIKTVDEDFVEDLWVASQYD